MASVVITLTAIAVWRYVRSVRAASSASSAKVAEAAFIASVFPKELQDQILADFTGPISVFCANRYERRGLIGQMRKTREAQMALLEEEEEEEKEKVVAAAADGADHAADADGGGGGGDGGGSGEEGPAGTPSQSTDCAESGGAPPVHPSAEADAPKPQGAAAAVSLDGPIPTAAPIGEEADPAAAAAAADTASVAESVGPTGSDAGLVDGGAQGGAELGTGNADSGDATPSRTSRIANFFRRRLGSQSSKQVPAQAAAAVEVPPSNPRPPPPPRKKPAGMPHLTSPSADPSQWDPVTVKEEASNALLLLWAVVDLLKKGASINASNEGQDLTAADNNPNGSVEDPASLSPSLSASTVQAASSNPTSPSEEATSLENVESTTSTPDTATQRSSSPLSQGPEMTPEEAAIAAKLAAMTRKEREVEILSKFHATSLISILQMVQAIEAMLLEKFTVLRQHSWDSSPLAAADANGNADGDKQDALAQETGDAGELVGNVGFGGPSYDSQLLHKISLGWGVVGMIMETESKEELRILTEQNRMRWEGQSEGFLVRTIQELLDERDIEPLELVRL